MRLKALLLLMSEAKAHDQRQKACHCKKCLAELAYNWHFVELELAFCKLMHHIVFKRFLLYINRLSYFEIVSALSIS